MVHFVLFGAFGTVWLPYETRCNTGRTSAKFVSRSRVRIFRNELTRSTPLDPKLTFWCVSYYLDAFGTVWLSYKTRCKTGELVQKFMPRSHVGMFRNKRTRSTPLDPKLTFLVCFILFGCIRNRLVSLLNSVQNGPY